MAKHLMLKCYACVYPGKSWYPPAGRNVANRKRCNYYDVKKCLEPVDEVFIEECPVTWEEWHLSKRCK